MMRNLIIMLLCCVFCAVASIGGLSYKTWEFWVMTGCLCGVEILSAINACKVMERRIKVMVE